MLAAAIWSGSIPSVFSIFTWSALPVIPDWTIIRTVVSDTVVVAGAREWADVPQEVNHRCPPLACAGACRPNVRATSKAAAMATEDRVNFCLMKDVIAFSLLWLLVCARRPRR
jgi:hypothetical protein